MALYVSTGKMAYLSQWLTFRTIRIFNIQPYPQMTKGHLERSQDSL